MFLSSRQENGKEYQFSVSVVCNRRPSYSYWERNQCRARTCMTCIMLPMADLHSEILDAPPPLLGGPNSFNFMQLLGKFGKMLTPSRVSTPHLGEILDPPLAATFVSNNGYYNSKFTTVSYLRFPLPVQKLCTEQEITILFFFSYILIYNGES